MARLTSNQDSSLPRGRENPFVHSTMTIVNVRVFDGERLLSADTVTVIGDRIAALGDAPSGEVIDGRGGTLIPGLIDAHTHTSRDSLAQALRFGVTTELEMAGGFVADVQARVSDDPSLADVRSAGVPMTAPGGHPTELFPDGHQPPVLDAEGPTPFIASAQEAAAGIAPRIAAGSDYIKVMIDDGKVASRTVPSLDGEIVSAAVQESHHLGRLVVAHAMTLDDARTAILAGVDGLAHVFMDRPHTSEIIEVIARSGAFVTACVVVNASMMGHDGADLADDPRVAPSLWPEAEDSLRASFDRYPQGSLDDVLATVRALSQAGVDILAGTDAAEPRPCTGGVAHGASLHRELRYLVEAGLTPTQALHAATAGVAKRFHLSDRGRIAPGLRADLVLLAGDPTRDIDTTLAIREVWRSGVRQPAVPTNRQPMPTDTDADQ